MPHRPENTSARPEGAAPTVLSPFAQRYECKYLVPDEVALRLRDAALQHLTPDPHAARSKDCTYPIASLYLDSEDDALCHETAEGLATRFKLRIRAYADGADEPVFAEIKGRHCGIVHKQRCRIARTDLRALLALDLDALDAARVSSRTAVEEFVRLAAARRAGPRLLVRYDREAYQGRFDPEVRVTFDRRLRTQHCQEARVSVHDRSYVEVATKGTVVELKYTQRSPVWMVDLVRRFQLERRSFSKYGTCHDALRDRDDAWHPVH